jgi:hypothetical protein
LICQSKFRRSKRQRCCYEATRTRSVRQR